MQSEFIIVGAGIGGLAAALALGRVGRSVLVLEQAQAFAEAGAGIQLGPNAVRVLQALGLQQALDEVAAWPERLQALDAQSGRVLGTLPLGQDFVNRYGAPYLTLHRADLHELLLRAQDSALVRIERASAVASVSQSTQAVSATVSDGRRYQGVGLLACDGLWSSVRRQVWADAGARATGHIAYRALLDGSELPAQVARDQVSVWLGPALHAVAYPVRRGTAMNLVVVTQAQRRALAGDATDGLAASWDMDSDGQACMQALRGMHAGLAGLAQAVPAQRWRCWTLHERAPMLGPGEMARGRIALLGDAAHPMRPYLAQGAAMALEDAQALAQAVQGEAQNLALAFKRYAQQRWRRNARVQRKARLNGTVFHAQGALRVARNLAMRLSAGRLMDMPWLYAQPKPNPAS